MIRCRRKGRVGQDIRMCLRLSRSSEKRSSAHRNDCQRQQQTEATPKAEPCITAFRMRYESGANLFAAQKVDEVQKPLFPVCATSN
jgi:hypothetical protein